MRWAFLAVFLLSAVFVACGDDDTEADTDGSNSGSSSSDSDDGYGDDGSADQDEPKGVRVPLKEGSSGKIEAEDVGTAEMTIDRILSPADDILPAGLEPGEGRELWAIEGTVKVEGGPDAVVAEYFAKTDKGGLYGWTGTATGNDLGFGFEQGTPESGYLAFEIPKDEEIVQLVARFSIYQGYDIIFEK